MVEKKRPRVSIIAAIGKNRELGKHNELIWHISEDLKRVKKLTTGHPIIMGRRTYDSIGKPLPDRTNIVISQRVSEIDGCIVKSSLHDAVEYAKSIDGEEIFIFGGASIYAASLLFVDRLYLTIIEAEEPEADVYFPDYSGFKNEVSREDHPEHTPPYSFVVLEKSKGAEAPL